MSDRIEQAARVLFEHGGKLNRRFVTEWEAVE